VAEPTIYPAQWIRLNYISGDYVLGEVIGINDKSYEIALSLSRRQLLDLSQDITQALLIEPTRVLPGQLSIEDQLKGEQ